MANQPGGISQDWFRSGAILHLLLLRYGNLAAYESWYDKSVAAWNEVGLRRKDGREYVKILQREFKEVHQVYWDFCSVCLICGFEADAASLAEVIGCWDWEGVGFEQFWNILALRYRE